MLSSCENIWGAPSPSITPLSGRSEAPNKMPLSYEDCRTKRKASDNIWVPANGWLRHYRCAACREIMSRKIPAKCPQKILNCEHIVCANCIVKSYLIKFNPICPVKGCGKCVNPRTSPKPTIALPLFFTTAEAEPAAADLTAHLTAEYHLPHNLFDKENIVGEQVHNCSNPTCTFVLSE